MKQLLALALATTVIAVPSAANARDRHHDRDGDRHSYNRDRHDGRHHYRNYSYRNYGYYPGYSYGYYPRSRTVISGKGSMG